MLSVYLRVKFTAKKKLNADLNLVIINIRKKCEVINSFLQALKSVLYAVAHHVREAQ